MARIEAVVRRHRRGRTREDTGPLVAGELEVRPDRFQAYVGGESLELTRREFELLQVLADHGGKVLERDEIYQRVWGYAMIHGDRSVDVFVRKLRSKLQRRSPGWEYIHTHFGIGYRFDPHPIVAGTKSRRPLERSRLPPSRDAESTPRDFAAASRLEASTAIPGPALAPRAWADRCTAARVNRFFTSRPQAGNRTARGRWEAARDNSRRSPSEVISRKSILAVSCLRGARARRRRVRLEHDSSTSSSSAAPSPAPGARSIAPLMSKWQSDYSSKTGDTVTYGAIGSGGGIEQITARTVDFGASDAPMTSDQLSACKGCIQVPWSLGAVVPAYNLNGAPEQPQAHRAGPRRHLSRQDHDLERPGDREAEPGREPAVDEDHARVPHRWVAVTPTRSPTTSRRSAPSSSRRSARRPRSSSRPASAATAATESRPRSRRPTARSAT